MTILLPIYNPDEILLDTINSIVAQTNKAFIVLISDNYSTKGIELLDNCIAILDKEKIRYKKIIPPFPLTRVQHWNWMHYQANDDWLKPLFLGDSLEPKYVEIIYEKINEYPDCKYIYSAYNFVRGGHTEKVIPNWSGKFVNAHDMLGIVKRYAHQFGPPSAAAYTKDAFSSIGGYNYNLPISADSLFFCTLAASYGALGISLPLINFNIHSNRFSNALKGKNKQIFYEKITYELLVNYFAHTENSRIKNLELLKLFWHEFKQHYLRIS